MFFNNTLPIPKMIQYIKYALFFIFKKMINPEWIAKAISEEKIKYAKSACIYDKTTYFSPECRILNFKNDINSIQIGENSMILGELRVNKYGGVIKIGNFTHIGESSRVWSAEYIEIGNNVQISHNVNIMDGNTHSLDPEERHKEYLETLLTGTIAEKKNIQTAPIIIEDNVWISFNVTILKGVRIGKNAVVGANSLVLKDVPPYTFVAGTPAQNIKDIK